MDNKAVDRIGRIEMRGTYHVKEETAAADRELSRGGGHGVFARGFLRLVWRRRRMRNEEWNSNE